MLQSLIESTRYSVKVFYNAVLKPSPVVGDTLFNVIKIGEGEVKPGSESPVYPVSITSAEILSDPLGDIVPRTTPAERKRERQLKEIADEKREREVLEARPKMKRYAGN